MGQKIFRVDTFADKPFSGNPTGVCILAKEAESAWMQQIAREMICSGTIFVLRQNGEPILRYFNMRSEAEVRGHGVLACAHILWQEGYNSPKEEIHFKSAMPGLFAKHVGGLIEINLPSVKIRPIEGSAALLNALKGVKPIFVGKTEQDDFVEIDSEQTLRDWKPDFYLMEQLPTRGVIVTAKASTEGYDFVSRYFTPSIGLNEVPAGSNSHCTLVPYWAQKLNKKELVAYQASSRGGNFRCRLEGERVCLQGHAITTFRCELLI